MRCATAVRRVLMKARWGFRRRRCNPRLVAHQQGAPTRGGALATSTMLTLSER
jgi:hypothetical protein